MSRKPGRPRKKAHDRKSAQISVRLAPDLKKRLTAEASKKKSLLSQEVAERLEISFAKLSKRSDEFGDLTTYAFCRLIADVFMRLRDETGQVWTRHPWTFQHAHAALNELLYYFQPPGEPEIPDDAPLLAKAPDADREKIANLRRTLEVFPFGIEAARAAIYNVEFLNENDSHADRELQGIANLLKTRLLEARVDGRAAVLDWTLPHNHSKSEAENG